MDFKRQLLICSVLAAMAVGISSKSFKAEMNQEEEEGKVNVIYISGERLEFAYYKSTEEAIHVISEVQNDQESVHLSVTSMTGDVIFSLDRTSYSTALWSFGGSQFLLVNETRPNSDFKLTTYSVPQEQSRTFKNVVNRKRLLQPSLLDRLDHDNVNETGQSALEEFVMNPRVALLVEAAEALGESGVRGIDNRPAMVFYTAALRFAKMIRAASESEEGSAEITPELEESKPVRRQKRWFNFGWRCPNNGQVCTVCPYGSSCLGMCGPGCHTCWRWVCGHCCWSAGCYAHDLICSIRNRQFSIECIVTAPIGLYCSYWTG